MRLLALAILVFAAAGVVAQEEPMAKPMASPAADLSAGLPTQIIDTVTLPVNKTEVGAALGYVTDGGTYETGLIQVAYGILADLQGTAKLPLILGQGHVTGNFDSTLALLWAPVKEEETIPALGLELSGKFPTGYGFTGYDGTLNGIATKTFGEIRAHINAAYTTLGNNQTANKAHTDSFKIGADYMVVDNTCLIVDAFSNLAPVSGVDRVQGAEVGVRTALTDVDVLGVGIGFGLGNGNATPDFTATVSYQRAL
jgi:hypothetical protein